MSSPDGGDGPGPGPAVSAGAPGPRRDALLAELGREVRAVRTETRRETTRLDALLADTADLLAAVLPQVTELGGDLAGLTGRVDVLAAEMAGEQGGVAALLWPMLDAASAAREWEALADWIASTLGPWYEITRGQLPDCWAWHRPAVIELVWLRRCYVSAHLPTARPGASAEWHTRWRRDALANIAAAISPVWCRPGEHRVHRADSSTTRTSAPPRPAARPSTTHPRAAAVPALLGDPTAARGARISTTEEITSPTHWWSSYQAASAAYLAWRRDRAATTAAAPPDRP